MSTDEYGRVLVQGGKVVDGLYAVGNDAVSAMGRSHLDGGITLGPAMTFGFVAGEHVENEKTAAGEAPIGYSAPIKSSAPDNAAQVAPPGRCLPNFR
ncbi:FAD-binding protein [Burkholderia sp. SCN-KJ]|uniref:FAD-binding protein n=1 Tax=Burkholderia sp. SCN-KJ TaxID=2969248 RepID=UPI0035ADCDC3